jgi:hypothetical protein
MAPTYLKYFKTKLSVFTRFVVNLGDFFLPSYLGSAVVSFQEAAVAVGLAVAGAERSKLL